MYIPPKSTSIDTKLVREFLINSKSRWKYDNIDIEKCEYLRTGTLLLKFSHELYYQHFINVEVSISEGSIHVSCQENDGQSGSYPFPINFFEFLNNLRLNHSFDQAVKLKENANNGMSFEKNIDYVDGAGIKREFKDIFIEAISTSSRNQAPNLLVCSNETGELYKISPRDNFGTMNKYDFKKGDRFTSLTRNISSNEYGFHMKYEDYSKKFTIASAGKNGDPEIYFDKLIRSKKEILERRKQYWKENRYEAQADDNATYGEYGFDSKAAQDDFFGVDDDRASYNEYD